MNNKFLRILQSSNEFRLYGPPGTGKTTTLSALISDACRTYGSDGVLVASFTKTAATELVGRGLPIDRERLGTLHALCYHALGRPKLAVGKALDDWNMTYPEFALTTKEDDDAVDLNFDERRTEKLGGEKLMQAYLAGRARMVSRDAWNTETLLFGEKWEAWKAATHLLDFTDLIEIALRDMTGPPLPASVLFLDEVQDFSVLELTLARQWGQSMTQVVLAGDDDQCIFTFKGATPEAFLTPDLPDDQKRVLSQSYRIPRAVHALASAWIQQVAHRQAKAYQPRDVDGSVDVSLGWSSKNPDGVLDDLEGTLAAGKTAAILATCSYMLDPIKKRLKETGVPFHNPHRRKRGDWNPLMPRQGTTSTADRVLAFLKVSRTPGAWWSYADFHAWASLLDTKKVLTHGAKSELRTAAEATPGAAVTTAELSAWFTCDDPTPIVSGDLRWLRRHVLPSAEQRLNYALSIVEARGAEALEATPRVVLGTIHSVKGSEADVVYLLPDLAPSAALAWQCRETMREQFDAIIRCFYVGMTRAREALVWGTPVGSAAINPYTI